MADSDTHGKLCFIIKVFRKPLNDQQGTFWNLCKVWELMFI